MVCLETTFLIDLLQDKNKALEILNSLPENETIFVASPTVMEIWSGALGANFPEKEKARINDMLSSVNVLALSEEAAKEAAEIQHRLLAKGKMISTIDIMIASIAITNGEKLLTRDEGYARIDNLRMEKY